MSGVEVETDLHSFGRTSSAAARPALLRDESSSVDASVRADGGDLPGWMLRVASVAGVRHRLAGRGADDAFAWRVVHPDDSDATVLVVAVADGVGSVSGSGLAASAAATSACRAVSSVLVAPGTLPAGGRIGALPAGGAAAIGEAFTAATLAVSAAGGATTLVLAAVDDTGAGWAARLGDSSGLILSEGTWRPLWPEDFDPERPSSSATAALPTSAPDVDLAEVALAPGDALVLVTDGVADPLRDGPTTVAPALAERLGRPLPPVELASLVDFSRHGCIDDRTLLALWRVDAG